VTLSFHAQFTQHYWSLEQRGGKSMLFGGGAARPRGIDWDLQLPTFLYYRLLTHCNLHDCRNYEKSREYDTRNSHGETISYSKR